MTTSDWTKYAAQITHGLRREAFDMVMKIRKPSTRVRAYLGACGHFGKVHPETLAALLDVSPGTVRKVLKEMHYTDRFFGKRDGYWYPTSKTWEGSRD